MSSKSKTLFQGLPKCSQVPAGEVSSDPVTLALLLKMRAMGCLIPQCVCMCCVTRAYIQRPKKWLVHGLVKFPPAVPSLFCLALPGSFFLCKPFFRALYLLDRSSRNIRVQKTQRADVFSERGRG